MYANELACIWYYEWSHCIDSPFLLTSSSLLVPYLDDFDRLWKLKLNFLHDALVFAAIELWLIGLNTYLTNIAKRCTCNATDYVLLKESIVSFYLISLRSHHTHQRMQKIVMFSLFAALSITILRRQRGRWSRDVILFSRKTFRILKDY